MGTLAKVSLSVVFALACSSRGSGSPAHGDAGPSDERPGDAAEGDTSSRLDGTSADGASASAFTVYPGEIEWSGQAGYGGRQHCRDQGPTSTWPSCPRGSRRAAR